MIMTYNAGWSNWQSRQALNLKIMVRIHAPQYFFAFVYRRSLISTFGSSSRFALSVLISRQRSR